MIPQTHETKSVAILGAGQMGIAIAAAVLRRRFSVVMFDSSSEAVKSAAERIAAELEIQNESAKFQTQNELTELNVQIESTELKTQQKINVAETLRFFESTNDLQAIRSASFILESVTEKKRVKEKLYRQIMPFLNENALLMSNTSTISISELAETFSSETNFSQTNLSHRFCGFHFFHPVRSRPLVEIIRGKNTSDETIQRASALAHAIQKTPLVVNDGPGFLVNRLLNAYLTGALQLLTEGGTIRQIDDAAERFGMAMGPFRIMDEIGLDVTLHGGWVLYKAFPDRVEPSPILLELTRLRHLGRKTYRGFYCYEQSQTKSQTQMSAIDNIELNAIIAEQCSASSQSLSDEMILARTVGEMFREGTRILADGITCSPKDIELAAVLGLGFPQGKWEIL